MNEPIIELKTIAKLKVTKIEKDYRISIFVKGDPGHYKFFIEAEGRKLSEVFYHWKFKIKNNNWELRVFKLRESEFKKLYGKYINYGFNKPIESKRPTIYDNNQSKPQENCPCCNGKLVFTSSHKQLKTPKKA